MRRFTEVDERVYEAAMRYRDNARELLDPAFAEQPCQHTDVRRRVVAKTLGVSDDVIRETSSLRDLGVNSLDLVVLVMAIEEKYRIEFDPSDLERLRTFGDLARRVGELKGER